MKHITLPSIRTNSTAYSYIKEIKVTRVIGGMVLIGKLTLDPLRLFQPFSRAPAPALSTHGAKKLVDGPLDCCVSFCLQALLPSEGDAVQSARVADSP